jgi:hypothetical protein
MRKRSILFVIAAFLVAPAMVHSTTLVSTFGPGDTFGSACWLVRGSDTGERQDEGFKFTVTGGDHVLAAARVAIKYNSGAGDTVRLLVVQDNAGLPGTTVVDSALLPAPLPSTSAIRTATFSGGAILANGATYWLVAQTEPTTSTLQAPLSCGDASAPKGRAFRSNAGAWQYFSGDTPAAYSIEVADQNTYACYDAKDLNNPPFTKVEITLSDIFANNTYNVTKLDSVCAPAQRDGGAIADPSQYLCCYEMKPTKLDIKQEVMLDTPLQSSRARLEKSARVCLPCSVTPVP